MRIEAFNQSVERFVAVKRIKNIERLMQLDRGGRGGGEDGRVRGEGGEVYQKEQCGQSQERRINFTSWQRATEAV